MCELLAACCAAVAGVAGAAVAAVAVAAFAFAQISMEKALRAAYKVRYAYDKRICAKFKYDASF